MKAPTSAKRFACATKLLNYGFSNFSVYSFGKKGDVISNITVNKGSSSSVNAILESDAEILTKKSKLVPR